MGASPRCPGVIRNATGRPQLSTTAWIFVDLPPRERPIASASPPFPPAAGRCAFAVVLSIIWMSRSAGCTKASNSRRHIPLADQRWKRL